MSLLMIEDLETSNELDRQAMLDVYGGSSDIGVGQGVGGNSLSGLLSQGSGGGIHLFSPQIAIQTIVNTPVNLQMATILAPLTKINTTNIVNSVLAGL